MSAAVRNHDWSRTPLGPMHLWSASLRIAVDMLMASKFPGCLVWGPELVSIHNDAFVPILGGKPAPLGRSFDDIWSDVWDGVGDLVFRVMNGEAVFQENLALITNRNGVDEQVYFTFCYSPIRDEFGNVAGFLDTVFETTASVESERQWRDLATTFEHQVHERTADRNRFWELSSDVMLMVEADLRLRAFNPACQQVLGWGEDMLGLDVMQFVHPDDKGIADLAVEALESGQDIQGIENRLRHVDGHYRWFSWAATSNDGVITAVGRDITLAREREAALRQAEEVLRHSQKMEAVGQLTGGMAHDFNNLLTGISGSLEILERRLAKGQFDNLGKYIDAARAASARAATLTHRMLAFARRQPLAPTPANPNDLLRAVEPLIRQAIGPEIDLKLQYDPQPWPVLVDVGQLENALINLCLNARDAMQGSGCLTLCTGNERFAPGLHGPDGLSAGDYCFLRVEDNGCGMDDAVAARAFDPFFSTKPPGQGTGMGLSMVYGFACQSGGRAWIESKCGHGTRVSLLLPRFVGELPGTVAGDSQPPPAQRAGGERVLLIDDEPTLRMLMKEALEDQGFEVFEAADALSGLALFRSLEHLDLLVTDIGLPGGISGRQVASAVRQRRPQMKILFITGYTEGSISNGPLLEAGIELLTKPFTLDALTDKVGQLLQL
ncbi:hybrid sensor histidine kinase/response regulator [Pseudomonas sp. SDI]|nr:hybrid sensor histidine kinase/response regulator [Pseudomonas sp. SDI]